MLQISQRKATVEKYELSVIEKNRCGGNKWQVMLQYLQNLQ